MPRKQQKRGFHYIYTFCISFTPCKLNKDPKTKINRFLNSERLNGLDRYREQNGTFCELFKRNITNPLVLEAPNLNQQYGCTLNCFFNFLELGY